MDTDEVVDMAPVGRGRGGYDRQWDRRSRQAQVANWAWPPESCLAVPICVDSGCTMSLIDRRFLNEQIPGCQIRKTETLLT